MASPRRRANMTTLGSQSNDMTIDDYVKTITKKGKMGNVTDYKLPDNQWMYKNIIGGQKGMGGKKESWVISLEKTAKKVPGVGTHAKVTEWGKGSMKINGGIMNNKDRVTQLAELSKMKPTPGPATYRSEAGKDKFANLPTVRAVKMS